MAPCWVLSIRPNVLNIPVLTGEVGRMIYFIYPKLRDKYQNCVWKRSGGVYRYKTTLKIIKSHLKKPK